LRFATPPAPTRRAAQHAPSWEATEGIRAGGFTNPDSALGAAWKRSPCPLPPLSHKQYTHTHTHTHTLYIYIWGWRGREGGEGERR
jgi:hypothetical protein